MTSQQQQQQQRKKKLSDEQKMENMMDMIGDELRAPVFRSLESLDPTPITRSVGYASASASAGAAHHPSFQEDVYRSVGAVDMAPPALQPLYYNMETASSPFGKVQQHGGAVSSHHHHSSYGSGAKELTMPSLSVTPMSAATPSSSFMDSIASLSVQEEAQHGPARPPLAMFGYLEPHYHFCTSTVPEEMMHALEAMLIKCTQAGTQIDYRVSADKFKFDCACYSSGGHRIPFFIRIFALENSKQHAVEFQRRSGDPVRFCSVYRECVQALDQGSRCECDVPTTKPFQPPPVTPQANEDAAVRKSHSRQCITSLMQMVNAPYLDSQAEAMRALAKSCQGIDQVMQDVILECGVVQRFIKELQSQSDDVSRCAITGLVNLAALHNAAIAAAVVDAGGLDGALNMGNKSACPYAKRQCVQLYRHVVEQARDGVRRYLGVTASAHRDALQQIARSETSTQESVQRIIQVLM